MAPRGRAHMGCWQPPDPMPGAAAGRGRAHAAGFAHNGALRGGTPFAGPVSMPVCFPWAYSNTHSTPNARGAVNPDLRALRARPQPAGGGPWPWTRTPTTAAMVLLHLKVGGGRGAGGVGGGVHGGARGAARGSPEEGPARRGAPCRVCGLPRGPGGAATPGAAAGTMAPPRASRRRRRRRRRATRAHAAAAPRCAPHRAAAPLRPPQRTRRRTSSCSRRARRARPSTPRATSPRCSTCATASRASNWRAASSPSTALPRRPPSRALTHMRRVPRAASVAPSTAWTPPAAARARVRCRRAVGTAHGGEAGPCAAMRGLRRSLRHSALTHRTHTICPPPACDPEVAKKLLKELDDAEALASKVRAGRQLGAQRGLHPFAGSAASEGAYECHRTPMPHAGPGSAQGAADQGGAAGSGGQHPGRGKGRAARGGRLAGSCVGPDAGATGCLLQRMPPAPSQTPPP
jgi:hypothetical protein